MSAGCCHRQPRFDGTSRAYMRTLWIVIAINAVMFAVEMSAGAIAGSQALQADALDFLGDSLTYGLSLYVIGKSIRARTVAALFKGLTLAAMGLWVFGDTLYAVLVLGVPRAEIMGLVGFLALAANLACVLLLLRFRHGEANVRSVWLCSRNDAIGNVAVILAASSVWASGMAWPDLVVATAMAGLFIWSATQITLQALREYRQRDEAIAEGTRLRRTPSPERRLRNWRTGRRAASVIGSGGNGR